MKRKAFAQKFALLGVCPFVIQNLNGSELPNPTTYTVNAPETHIKQYSKLPWEDHSG